MGGFSCGNVGKKFNIRSCCYPNNVHENFYEENSPKISIECKGRSIIFGLLGGCNI